MKQHYYTIEISLNGIVWFVIGYYKFMEDRENELPIIREQYEKRGYSVRGGFDCK